MKTRYLLLFCSMLAIGTVGDAIEAQAEIFVSKKSNSSASSSSSDSGSIYVKPKSSDSRSNQGRSSDSKPAIYNKSDVKIKTYAPGGSTGNVKPGYEIDPRQAARDSNIEAAKKLSERTTRDVNRRMQEVRAKRQEEVATREQAWKNQQAKEAAAQKLRDAKAQGSRSRASGDENAPPPPEGVTTTKQVYNGGSRGTNSSGGRIFNAR